MGGRLAAAARNHSSRVTGRVEFLVRSFLGVSGYRINNRDNKKSNIDVNYNFGTNKIEIFRSSFYQSILLHPLARSFLLWAFLFKATYYLHAKSILKDGNHLFSCRLLKGS